jgi:16S rRNA (cytidine1402-2'-O)-methyltransferase
MSTDPKDEPRGLLSIVATPIGNLEDVTLRALRTLREASVILAEDTRRTRTLCAHHGIATPLRAFHAHTSSERVEAIVRELADGAHFALVSDAGTPVVSDPGAELVRAAAEAGVRIEPIPGPSAALAALSASGLRASSFRFVGFLPRSGSRRRAAIEGIVRSREATILFEAPGRVPATLAELAEHGLGDRPAALCRELTKLHEEIARAAIADLAVRFAEPPRGEVTLVIEGGAEDEAPAEDPSEVAQALLAGGMRTKDAARELSARTRLPMREAYALVLSLSRAEE